VTINSITGNTLLTSGSFPPVRAASTGAPLNPAAGGLLVVDGVQLVAGDRVLVKDEASQVNNGIYAASTGPWTRTTDATGNTQFFSGMAVTVALGAVNAGQTFICTCPDDPVVVGTSLITFASQQVVATATQSATSATSLAISTGSKTFTTQAGKAFQVGQWMLIQETSNSANQMLGQITAYVGTSLTVNVIATGGSGTHADWTIVLTNSPAAAGYQPPVGSGNVTGPGSSVAGHVATFADGTGKVLQDGGAIVGGPNTILPSMLANAAVAFGVGMLNGKLVASVAGNALTIAVKTLAGVDPSPTDPAFFLFRDASAGYAVIEQTAALSITVPSGATLGTVNGYANRIWVGVFNNGGTAVLGVYNSINAPNTSSPTILPWDETSPANGTGVTSSSTSAQLWYTASTLSSKVLRILGYVESTQSTAGTWATSPSKVQMFGPGVKRPGDTVQEVANFVSATASTTSATFVALTGENVSIIPQSAANVIRVEASGSLNLPTNGSGNTAINGSVQLSRGTTANTNLFGSLATLSDFGGNSSLSMQVPSFVFGYDVPNTVSSVTYAVQGKTNSLTTLTYGGATQMAAREVMT
jgi:hypothetical protein